MGDRLLTAIREKVAQAWRSKENEHKEMDVVLAETICQNIHKLIGALPVLHGRRDKDDGWEFHQKPGDFDTHRGRLIDLTEL